MDFNTSSEMKRKIPLINQAQWKEKEINYLGISFSRYYCE